MSNLLNKKENLRRLISMLSKTGEFYVDIRDNLQKFTCIQYLWKLILRILRKLDNETIFS